MKILGIGNAIVDVICKVDEDFITNNNLTKSNMKLLFDENEFRKLLLPHVISVILSFSFILNSPPNEKTVISYLNFFNSWIRLYHLNFPTELSFFQ